jgi:hypothetical protein
MLRATVAVASCQCWTVVVTSKQNLCIIEAEVREERGNFARIAQAHGIGLALANESRPIQKQPPEHVRVFYRKRLE